MVQKLWVSTTSHAPKDLRYISLFSKKNLSHAEEIEVLAVESAGSLV